MVLYETLPSWKVLTKILTIAALVIACTSCKDDGATPKRSVYVAGNTDWPYYPAWWIDGVASKGVGSATSGMETAVTCAYVDGTDVYHGGYQDFMNRKPAYWKNGTMTVMSPNTRCMIRGIFVAGGNVHCIGNTEYETSSKPTYWLNGTPAELPYNLYGEAAALYASGTDVYIVGYDEEGSVIWKNNVRTLLDADTRYANCITVSGSDVYVGGTVDGNPVYWKNGQRNVVSTSEGASSSNVVNIFVKGTDVYLVGLQHIASGEVVTYWHNGNPVIVDSSVGSAASAIFVDDDNSVYIAGVYTRTDQTTVPLYWKDGTMNPLSIDEQSANYLRGVATYISVH